MEKGTLPGSEKTETGENSPIVQQPDRSWSTPSLVVPAQQFVGAPGQIGHVRALWSRIRSRPARGRSHRFWRAATRELRLLISRAMMAAESASCSSRTLEQTTAFNTKAIRRCDNQPTES